LPAFIIFSSCSVIIIAKRPNLADKGSIILDEKRQKLSAESYTKPPQMWADSTVRKHVWAEAVYRTVSLQFEPPLAMWPLSAASMTAFIRRCGELGYQLDSVRYVIVASLKRIQVEKTGEKISDCLILVFCSLWKEFRNIRPDQAINKFRRHPAMKMDVQRIIGLMPRHYQGFIEESALYSLAG